MWEQAEKELVEQATGISSMPKPLQCEQGTSKCSNLHVLRPFLLRIGFVQAHQKGGAFDELSNF